MTQVWFVKSYSVDGKESVVGVYSTEKGAEMAEHEAIRKKPKVQFWIDGPHEVGAPVNVSYV